MYFPSQLGGVPVSAAGASPFGGVNALGSMQQGIQTSFLKPMLQQQLAQQMQHTQQMQAATPYVGPQALAMLRNQQLINQYYPGMTQAQINATQSQVPVNTSQAQANRATARNVQGQTNLQIPNYRLSQYTSLQNLLNHPAVITALSKTMPGVSLGLQNMFNQATSPAMQQTLGMSGGYTAPSGRQIIADPTAKYGYRYVN